MAKYHYKIAIMGASGVGKSVFLGSYFYSNRNLGKCKHTISVTDGQIDDTIGRMIDTLFGKREALGGTLGRYDLSFNVPDMGIDIELFDVAGGDTTSHEIFDYWNAVENGEAHDGSGASGIVNDLINADGAIFFLSAPDLMTNREQIFKVNSVFSLAINIIRSHRNGKRADVPIWLVYTKCDMVPGVEKSELDERAYGLLKQAMAERESDVLDKTIENGKNVRTYMCQAMGTWTYDDQTGEPLPPTSSEYHPINVAEPMDEMFETIRHSEGAVIRGMIKLFCVAMLIGFVGVFASAYWFDYRNGALAREQIAGLIEKNDYQAAFEALDTFQTPLGLDAILPAQIRAEKGMYSLRRELSERWETFLYNALKPAIDRPSSINKTMAPIIDTYMEHQEFAQIAPEHYKEVHDSLWRFRIIELLEGVPVGSKNPDEILEYIKKLLNADTGDDEDLRKKVSEQASALMTNWAETLSSNADIPTYDGYISSAGLLAGNPNVTDPQKSFLTKNAETWKKARDEKEMRLTVGGIVSAKTLDDLSTYVATIGRLRTNERVVNELDKKINMLADASLKDIRAGYDKGVLAGDFEGLKRELTLRFNALKTGLQKLQEAQAAQTALKETEALDDKLSSGLQLAHFKYCKQEFEKRSKGSNDSRDIQACIDVLNKFFVLWPSASSTKEGQEARQAISFLEAIRGGISGTLRLSGNFSGVDDIGGPDIRLQLTADGSTYTSSVVKDNSYPSWSFNFTWRLGMPPLGVVCIEEDLVVDDFVMQESVNLNGFEGFQNLNRTIGRAGCSIKLSFETSQSIPKCPW